MTDDEYIASLHREHAEEMRRYKITKAALLLGIGICLCIILAVALT